MFKICIAIRLIVLVAIWREISGRGNLNKYGRPSCYYKCPNSCATCTFDSGCLCSQCTDHSKYGDYCTKSCSAGCDGGTCNIDGSCTCRSHYSGDKCDLKNLQICPDKCQTCASPTNCQTCIDGYYNGYIFGSKDYTTVCKHSCRQNCIACTSRYVCTRSCPDACATCTVDSYDNGYQCTQCTYKSKYGDDCTTSCSAGCDGGTCKIDGSCTCITGYSGEKCDVVCPDKCQTCISSINCKTCFDGYYNNYINDRSTHACKSSCRNNCKACTEYNSCTSCAEGFYGQHCQHNCSSGCQQGTCIQESGTCVCISGFRGDKCDQCIAGRYSDNCRQMCLSQTCKNNICIRDSGRCSACNFRYYGNNMCEKACSTSCKNSACDFTTGICTHGCISGYSGDKCCIKNERCLTCFSYSACSKCISGYSGDKCCIKTERCLTCSSTSACSKCISGYSGNQCHCPTNCETCNANDQCKSCFAGYDNINKNCSECARNKYGADCQSECSDNCLNNGENTNCGNNGTCFKGCEDGYYGGKCDLRCDQNCRRFTCSRFDGICSNGCQKGFRLSGSICVLVGFPVAIFSVSICGTVVFAVVIAVVVLLLMKRRNNRSQCCCATTTDVTVQEDTTHVYLTAIYSGTDRVGVTGNADDSVNRELDVQIHNNPDTEESTTGSYEVPIQHRYETIRDDFEPLNKQEHEQGNYDRRIVHPYATTTITNC